MLLTNYSCYYVIKQNITIMTFYISGKMIGKFLRATFNITGPAVKIAALGCRIIGK
jgi:hypothetical protein